MLNAVIVSFSFLKLNVLEKVGEVDRAVFVISLSLAVQISTSLLMIITLGYFVFLNLNQMIIDEIQQENHSIAKVTKLAAVIFDRVCDIFETISKFFALITLVFLMVVIFFNVFLSYTFFVYLKTPTILIFFFLFATFSLALFYVPFALWINGMSSAVQSQSISTCNLMQHLISRRGDYKSMKHAKTFELLVAHRQPKLSCGMFDLDWKLVFTMVGSIFSLSVIVIQFTDV